MLPHYEGGHYRLDVSKVFSLQAQLVDRYGEKWRENGEACQAEGLVFQTLPLEAGFGTPSWAWGGHHISLICDLQARKLFKPI